MKRIYFAVIAAMLALGLLAGPAVAANTEDVGVVLNAAATVSKGADADGCADGTGGAIGLPVVNGLKKAYYDFQNQPTTISTSALHGAVRDIHLCGQLDPMPEDYDNAFVDIPDAAEGLYGAACGGSASSNGAGQATMTDGLVVDFSGVGWKASAGSVFVATGQATTAGKSGVAGLLALVSARGVGDQCLNKTNDGKTGSMEFTVDFVYVIADALPEKTNTK